MRTAASVVSSGQVAASGGSWRGGSPLLATPNSGASWRAGQPHLTKQDREISMSMHHLLL
jgi:hypothetical protein